MVVLYNKLWRVYFINGKSILQMNSYPCIIIYNTKAIDVVYYLTWMCKFLLFYYLLIYLFIIVYDSYAHDGKAKLQRNWTYFLTL